jgi:hypothetical protein
VIVPKLPQVVGEAEVPFLLLIILSESLIDFEEKPAAVPITME